jgi:ATP-dependent RNA helicase DBP3
MNMHEGNESKRLENNILDVRAAKKDKKKKRKDASDSAQVVVPAIPTPPLVVISQAEQDAFLTQHSITIHSEIPIAPVISFDQLTVDPKLRPAFEGFTSPTPIQACTWPPALDGKDVVGIAETGRYVVCYPIFASELT